MNFEEFHSILADQGIGIFNIDIDCNTRTLIHPAKTVDEWRIDLRSILNKSKVVDPKGNASNFDIVNEMISEFGYFEAQFLADDVYEGRRAIYKAGIIDDPHHENQEDGFGHYGFSNTRDE